MKIDYTNIPKGQSKHKFTVYYLLNKLRTWYYFNIKWPWVKYNGFVRVMAHCDFAKRNIEIGNKVQFGPYCSITTDVKFGSNILLAGFVSIIGKHDHATDLPCVNIWDSPRGKDSLTIIEDDVWIGHRATIIAGATIGKGSVVAACSLVTKDIPPCEIWGGIPAKKIRDRFMNESEKENHIRYLSQRKIDN